MFIYMNFFYKHSIENAYLDYECKHTIITPMNAYKT